MEGQTAHKAGEALVLAGDRVERKADQPGDRKDPKAVEGVDVEGTIQAQPKVEPNC